MKRLIVLFLILVSLCAVASAHILSLEWWNADLPTIQYARFLLMNKLGNPIGYSSAEAAMILFGTADRPSEETISRVLLSGWTDGTVEELENAVEQLESHILSNGGELLGSVSSPVQPEIKSYTVNGIDTFTVDIGLDENGRIASISIPSHNETPGIGATLIEDTAVFDALIGQDIADAEIDIRAGATLTSNAINDALRQAAAEASGTQVEIQTATVEAEVAPEPVSIAYSGTIIKNDVNIRSRPGGSSLERVGRGTKVEIIGSQTDSDGVLWLQIVHGKTTGYVRADMVELTDGDTPPGADARSSAVIATADDPVYSTGADGQITVSYSEIRDFCLYSLDEEINIETVLKGELSREERKTAIDDAVLQIKTYKATLWWARQLGFKISTRHERELLQDAEDTITSARKDLESAISGFSSDMEPSIILNTSMDYMGNNTTVLVLHNKMMEALQYCVDNDETFDQLQTLLKYTGVFDENSEDASPLIARYFLVLRNEANFQDEDLTGLYDDLSLFDPKLRY